MTPTWDRRVRVGCALLACACAGALADGLLRMKYITSEPGVRNIVQSSSAGASTEPVAHLKAAPPAERIAQWTGPPAEGTAGALRTTRLRVPIDGISIESLKGGFDERRGGDRPHEAADILAPRNTPILAVENGTVAKLFNSKAGGLTIYQYDPSGSLAYYYAHLERYADGLHEGQTVVQGEVLGYVGTSGNAPANTPHLHFAIFELDDTHRWWKGKPLDPYLVFKSRG